MKKKFLLLLILLQPVISLCVPQSGVWRSGGIANYSLISSDSVLCSYIQIQEQKVLIQLYPGFAVTKTTYQMSNTGMDTITLEAGFPVNSKYESSFNYELCNIYFENSYSLKVIANGKICDVTLDSRLEDPASAYPVKQDWYVWKNIFPPGSITEIEIYSLVNTGNSEMTSGWSHSYDDVFVYMLHSKMAFKEPITSGEIFIQLMDELESGDIKGISPSIFKIDHTKGILHYQFTNLLSKDYSNIIVSYDHANTSTGYASANAKSENYFKAIDELENFNFASLQLKTFNPGDHLDFQSNTDDPILKFLFFIGGIVVVIIFVVLSITGVFRSKKSL